MPGGGGGAGAFSGAWRDGSDAGPHLYTEMGARYIMNMDRSERATGVRRAVRRVSALAVLVAMALPAARGPLCTAGGHEASHASTHDDADAAGVLEGASNGGAAIDDSSNDAGCHRLMACGVTLVAVEWAEAPTSAAPAPTAAPARTAGVAAEGPSLRPTPPPPRA